jgi:hypothetical protein
MILGFTGKPDCGKSTAARFLVDTYGWAWINVGDPIKEMLAGYYKSVGLSWAEITRRLIGDLKEKPDPLLLGKTPRFAMQTLGKEWRDIIDPDLFTFAWDIRIPAGKSVVADGMRYPDELPRFKARNGVLVHMIRPGTDDNGGEHVAEKLQLVPDVTIINDGTIGDLHAKIDQLVLEVAGAA